MAVDSDESAAHAYAMRASEQAGHQNRDGSDGFRGNHSPISMRAGDEVGNTSAAAVLPNACKHCGQRLYTSKELDCGFCCNGCSAAYSLINGLGLGYYYCLRDSAGERQTIRKTAADSQFNHFDGAEFRARFVRELSGSQSRIDFQCNAVHCSACVWLLEKLPEVLPGVDQVRVDLARAKIAVWFDPSKIDLSTLGRTLAGLGYDPHPIASRSTAFSDQAADVTFALQIGVAAFCSMNVMLLFIGRYQGLFSGMEEQYAGFFSWVSLALAVPAVTFSALPFYRTSIGALRLKRFHIDLPISIAIVGGFLSSAVNTALGRSEIYYDTVTALIFLLLLGRWFQRRGMKKVALASEMLYAIAPLSAIKITHEGAQEVFVEALRSGDTIKVPNGARIPADAILLSGDAIINNALISGESAPCKVSRGNEVYCGALNAGPEFTAQVTAVAAHSRIGNILQGIESASVRDSKTASFTDKVAQYFVAGVLALSVLTFLLFIGEGMAPALDRVFALLIVSCPCALGIATPIVMSLANARAARAGILLKSGSALERCANIEKIYFDKTGTLTHGKPAVVFSHLQGGSDASRQKINHIIQKLESGIEHPAAEALRNFAGSGPVGPDEPELVSRTVINGAGVMGEFSDGVRRRIGSLRWIKSEGVNLEHLQLIPDAHTSGSTIVALSEDNQLKALFALRDSVRDEAAEAIADLARRGVTSGIISGDSSGVVGTVGESIGLSQSDLISEASPEQKAAILTEAGEGTALVGDGVNDALALSKAGIGIGISGGAEVCLKVSDVFLLRPDLGLITELIDGARSAQRLVRRHLIVSLVYNVSAAVLAISGFIGPLAAALIMPASSISVILSSLWNAPFKKEAAWK
ncbi:MAG: heavy metal translocating P-type ATPase [Deltaproteobacteria bacterium]|nr:heavy metal translocating P-type ATPase [Deltaproteobacteria bacterium]